MWTDNETEIDFLNFSGVAKTAAAMIRQVQPKPVSIGISGAWGVGKSSLIKLIRNELMLDKRKPNETLPWRTSSSSRRPSHDECDIVQGGPTSVRETALSVSPESVFISTA